MTTLIMPSDYGIEMLLGSPVLGSGFLGGSSCFSDYNRCSPMWSPASPASCLSDPVTTISAKSVQNNFTTYSDFEGKTGTEANGLNGPGFTRTGSTRKSSRNSTRKRKVGTFELPLQLQQTLKSCLASKAEEQVPEGAMSPTKEKKKVSFADMTGGNLTHIKIITERPDCPPRWSSDFLEQYCIFQLIGGAKAEAIPDEWALTFSQPAADYISWKNRLERDNIALENVVIKESKSILGGTIKVRNISFEKTVLVRYTTTNWLSHDEVYATYMETPSTGSSYSIYDTFTFKLPLPSSSQADKIEFCLCYYADGMSFWDNNNDKNYVVVSFKSKKGDATPKPSDLYDVSMDRWSEFSAWNHLSQDDSPYW